MRSTTARLPYIIVAYFTLFMVACKESVAQSTDAEVEMLSPWNDQQEQQMGAFRGAEYRVGEKYQPMVCFVVRTYWGHGTQYGDKSLPFLLYSLQMQRHKRWEALLLVFDDRPFSELRDIVRERQDPRIWVFAEWIGRQNAAKDQQGGWVDGYHSKLYNLTDEAIRACPPETEWLVVTNGDNLYDPAFLDYLPYVDPSVDVVAYDFYSRYQRPTHNPCDRFSAAPAPDGTRPPACKTNENRFCHTDLAASAYRYSKFIAEDRRFGPLDPEGVSTANDGLMAAELNKAGWKVHTVSGRCLVQHSPNPQQCALRRGVWDDSGFASSGTFGGNCISPEQAAQMLAVYRDTYEVVSLNVTFDPDSFDFKGLQVLPMTCIRYADRSMWQQAYVYGRVCAARMDYDALPHATLGPHPWDDHVPPELIERARQLGANL